MKTYDARIKDWAGKERKPGLCFGSRTTNISDDEALLFKGIFC